MPVMGYEMVFRMRFHPLLATPFAFLPAYKAGHPAWLRDELLGLNGTRKLDEGKASLRLLRRSKKIEELPSSQQKTLLKTIDPFLKGAGK